MLVTRKVDVLYTREPFGGKGPDYVLTNAGVEVRMIGEEDLQKHIEEDNGRSP